MWPVGTSVRNVVPSTLAMANCVPRVAAFQASSVVLPVASIINFLSQNVALNAPGSYTCPLRRSEEHTSELQSLMRISHAVCCLNNKIPLKQLTGDNNYTKT